MEQNTEALLRDLAEKLGTTTERLYGVLVKQAKVRIIKSIFTIGFFIIISIFLYVITRFVHYDDGVYKIIHHNMFDYSIRDEQDSWPICNILFVIIWVISSIGWIISITEIKSAVDGIVENNINPEYQALQDVIDTIKR